MKVERGLGSGFPEVAGACTSKIKHQGALLTFANLLSYNDVIPKNNITYIIHMYILAYATFAVRMFASFKATPNYT